MSRAPLRIVLGFVLLLSVSARADEGDHHVPAIEAQPKADAAAQETLDHKLPDVSFKDKRFDDVIDFFRDVGPTNIFVNWRVLEAVGVKKSVPVTVHLRDIKFDKALRTVLDIAGGGKVKLDYTIDEDIFTISTAEDLRANISTTIYDVRDLLAAPESAVNANQTHQQRIDTLFKLLTGSVDPDSWRENGGQIGAVKERSGQLIVTQTESNQKSIANLLAQTRKLMGIEVK
jgi:hypothetical protein